MVTILLIVLMSVGKKRMPRIKRRRATRIKAMVRLTLERNGTRTMRVLILIVMVWPPWQSRAPPLLQAKLSFPNSTKGSILA
jgi:hypothetical protein